MDFRLLDPNAAAKGSDQVNQWAQRAAEKVAGQQIAAGNRQGAQDHLNRNGFLGPAQNLMQQDWAIENREIAATDRARTEEDRQREIQQAAEKREAETLGTMAKNLTGILQTDGKEAVLPAFDAMSRTWISEGATPEQIAAMRQELVANPEQFLAATGAAASEALSRYQFNTVGGAVVRADKRTGDVREMYKGDQYIQADPTKNFVRVPGTGTGAADASSPTGTGSPLRAQTTPDAIKELFPGANITGTDRNPDRNREVGGAEKSWHLQPGKAVDVAPIEGETVASVKAKLEAAGWTVHEALDETQRTNGTGPHWHFAASPPTGARAAPSRTPEVVVAGRPRETDSWRNMTAAEVAAAGMRPGTSAQVNGRTGQTRVAQQPASGASSSGSSASSSGANRPSKLSAQEEVTLKDLRKEVAQSQNTRPILEQMRSLARDIETGGLYAMPGSAAVAGAFDSRVRRFQSLTDQMTPLMRNGLPGAASDRDVAMFRSAAPSLDKPREANLAGINAGIALANRQGDYLAFMDAYANENNTLRGASEMWSRYINEHPLFDQDARGLPTVRRVPAWRSYFRDGLGSGGRSTPAPRTATQGIEVPTPDGQVVDVRPGAPPARRRYNPATGRVE